MTQAEINQINEINRLKEVCKNTTNKYLIRDYQKAIKRKEKELKMYRALYYA